MSCEAGKIRLLWTRAYTVKSVQKGVAGSVRSGGASVGLATLAELERLTTEGTLIDLAFICSREGQTEVFELDNGFRCFSAHVLNRIRISQPVGTLDGVVIVCIRIVLVWGR